MKVPLTCKTGQLPLTATLYLNQAEIKVRERQCLLCTASWSLIPATLQIPAGALWFFVWTPREKRNWVEGRHESPRLRWRRRDRGCSACSLKDISDSGLWGFCDLTHFDLLIWNKGSLSRVCRLSGRTSQDQIPRSGKNWKYLTICFWFTQCYFDALINNLWQTWKYKSGCADGTSVENDLEIAWVKIEPGQSQRDLTKTNF